MAGGDVGEGDQSHVYRIASTPTSKNIKKQKNTNGNGTEQPKHKEDKWFKTNHQERKQNLGLH